MEKYKVASDPAAGYHDDLKPNRQQTGKYLKKPSGWPEVVIRHPMELAESLSYYLFEIGAKALVREQAIDEDGVWMTRATIFTTDSWWARHMPGIRSGKWGMRADRCTWISSPTSGPKPTVYTITSPPGLRAATGSKAFTTAGKPK